MKVAVLSEWNAGEPRVAATPETVKKIKALGAEVVVQHDAGLKSGILDSDYQAAGATIVPTAQAAAGDADIVLRVRRPSEAETRSYRKGALVIGTMDPFGNEAALNAMAKTGIAAFAMELLPRITRAQVMDVLSSQANLAGYRADVELPRSRFSECTSGGLPCQTLTRHRTTRHHPYLRGAISKATASKAQPSTMPEAIVSAKSNA